MTAKEALSKINSAVGRGELGKSLKSQKLNNR